MAKPSKQAPGRPRLLTLQGASAETGIPVNTLRDLIARGHLPRVILPQVRRTFLARDDVERLLTQSREVVT